jgi:hypothetical protein
MHKKVEARSKSLNYSRKAVDVAAVQRFTKQMEIIDEAQKG